jgi:transcriptional regulator with XRE-family HTH domain
MTSAAGLSNCFKQGDELNVTVKKFGQALRRRREAGRLSLRQVAKRTAHHKTKKPQIPLSTLHGIEHGDHDPRLSEIAILARVFRTDVLGLIAPALPPPKKQEEEAE